VHFRSDPGAAPLTVALSVVSSLLVGAILVAVPWMQLWELNSLIQPYPALRGLVLSPFTRGAVTGLGLVNVVLALHELRLLLGGRPQA